MLLLPAFHIFRFTGFSPEETKSQINLLFITDPLFHHLPFLQDWSHAWSSRKRSCCDWKTLKKSAASLGSLFQWIITFTTENFNGLFPVWINLGSAFTYVLHFVLLNRLYLESSIQQFISFTIRHFFETLTRICVSFPYILQIFQYLLQIWAPESYIVFQHHLYK